MILSDTTDLIVAQSTHAGETGKNNEDRSFVAALKEKPNATEVVTLAMVADGIGGHAAGEIASDLAVHAAHDHFINAPDTRDVPGTIRSALVSANLAIYDRAEADRHLQGMGSTAVVAAVVGRRLYGAHVGDSRMYLMRGGAIRQLTVDHTWVQEAINAGLLTHDEAKRHPNRHVIRRYLGHDLNDPTDLELRYAPNQTPDQMAGSQGLPLQDGDTLLLCSDGLTDLVEDEEIRAIVAQAAPQQAAEKLVLLARQRGGFDNITVILLKVPGGLRPSLEKTIVQRRPRSRASLLTVGAIGVAALLVVVVLVAVVAALFFGGLLPDLSASPTPIVTATIPSIAATSTPTAPPAFTLTPTPSETPTPTASQTPSITPTPPALVTVRTNLAKVHSGPGPFYRSIGSLPSGATAVVFGQDQSKTWFYVEFPPGSSDRGWVARSVVDVSVDPDSLPIITATPPG
ncbi:MAG: protein phosphatase 2C domain-containing protein [Chloroflexi bacterium]|nr:protein phosphatase 2C domain-containing protein [Chloroflexota bacterium]